jgi:hypothetical protein
MVKRISFLLAILVCVGGCGSSTPVVRGKVTYKNNPVTSGEVRFLSETGLPGRAGLISSAGTYEIRDAPLGDVKVAVISYKSAGAAKATVGEKGKKSGSRPGFESAIPAKYADFAISGLTYTVTSGSQSFDIELKD